MTEKGIKDMKSIMRHVLNCKLLGLYVTYLRKNVAFGSNFCIKPVFHATISCFLLL